MTGKVKYYVVWKGRRTGVFDSWAECERQVKRFTGAEYMAFPSRQAAERALERGYGEYAGKPSTSGQWLFAPQPPVLESYCVDAACSGSPGPVEYRGVHTGSGREVFRLGPLAGGTNNVGEFLGLVHALAWLEERGLQAPVYSDSGTALAWVEAGRCKTGLERSPRSAPLFERIARAESWLREHPAHAPVLKWDTEAWGEIPADFNRK
jgi:ribonuclease HI